MIASTFSLYSQGATKYRGNKNLPHPPQKLKPITQNGGATIGSNTHRKIKYQRLPASLSKVRRLAEREVIHFQEEIERIQEVFEERKLANLNTSELNQQVFNDEDDPIATVAAKRVVDSLGLMAKLCQRQTDSNLTDSYKQLLSFGGWIVQVNHLLEGDIDSGGGGVAAGSGGGGDTTREGGGETSREEIPSHQGGLSHRLNWAIKENLIRYCVSLRSLCQSSIAFVDQYSASIDKNRPDLLAELTDLDNSVHLLHSLITASDWRTALTNSSHIFAYFKKIRASINKIYYLALEWVEEDRDFMNNVNKEIEQGIHAKEDLEERLNSLQRSCNQILSTISRLNKTLLNNQRDLRRAHLQFKKCRQASEMVSDRLHQLDQEVSATELAMQQQHTTSVNNNTIPTTNHRRLQRQMRRTNLAENLIVDEDEKLRKLQNRQSSLLKHYTRLCRNKDKISFEMMSRESRLHAKQDDLKVKRELLIQRESELRERKAEYNCLNVKLNDLKLLREKKGAISSLRELHNFGHVLPVKSEPTNLEKACSWLMSNPDLRWKQLYRKLPMCPDRSVEQRELDIERLDGFCARYDLPASDQINLALKKWLLFFHRGNVGHLVQGLRDALFTDLADHIENEFRISDDNDHFDNLLSISTPSYDHH